MGAELDHRAEHDRIIEVGATWNSDDPPPPEHPDELLTRHLFDAHGLAVDADQGSGVLAAYVFDMGLLVEHDEAHGGEDALDLCSQAGLPLDYYREARREAMLSPEERQAEKWARDRRKAEEGLSPTARRYLEEIRKAPSQTMTYTRRKDFQTVRSLERKQQFWLPTGAHDYSPGDPRRLVEVAWAEDSVTVKAL